MGTLEKAREYARNGMSLYMDTSDEQDIYCEDLIQAYLAGAKSEREELTRWHDPKEEVPVVSNSDEDYTLLLKDVRGKVWVGFYRAYNDSWWFDGVTGRFHTDVSGIQGWREIHE
mgnify:CR=1 FL=1|jgi:hypothetical protein|uniref:hypothetical protein n=1 Tax=Alistipes shahii TaxID=328814 RepID=UPI003AEF79E7